MEEPSARTPLQQADLARLQFLHAAQLAPDGRTVAYALSRLDAEADADRVAIWALSLETGEARQLTAGAARDTSPQWSPDGRQLAFLSTRSGTAQLYIMPIDGGEARQLTTLAQGVGGGPVWSPDGQWIAFSAGPAADPPDPRAPYRVTRHIYRFDELGYIDRTAQDIYIVAAAGGAPRQLTDDANNNTAPLWSPDGREILFNATMQPDTHLGYVARLRVIDLDGAIRDLTGDWGYSVAGAWTPDGRRVVFCGIKYGRPIGTKSDIWVVDRQGGAPECRTADLPLGSGSGLQHDMATPMLYGPRVLIDENGRAAYVQVQDGGSVHVYRVGLDGSPDWAAVVDGERSCTPLDLRARRLLFAVSTPNSPLDLYVAGPDGADERRLTQLNDELLAQRQLPTIEHLRFAGSDGVPVEGWIMQPATGTPPYPTILYIHGGPHSGFGQIFSCDFQLLSGAGYAVLFINHRGSTGYGNTFATQILGDWGNLDYLDLMAGVDEAVARGIADPDRLGCCGLSGGGNLTCWIVGQTERFRAAVPENPVTNWVSFYGVSDIGPWFAVRELGGLPHEIPEVYRRCSPITYAHRCRTPTLLIQGEADYRCPTEQSEQFYAVLKASGCVAEMLRLPGSSHAGAIHGAPAHRRAQNEALLEWMNRYVLGVER